MASKTERRKTGSVNWDEFLRWQRRFIIAWFGSFFLLLMGVIGTYLQIVSDRNAADRAIVAESQRASFLVCEADNRTRTAIIGFLDDIGVERSTLNLAKIVFAPTNCTEISKHTSNSKGD